MQRVDLGHIRVRPANRLGRWLPCTPAVLWGLFILCWLWVWAGLWLPPVRLGGGHWPDAALLLLASATLAAGLTRRIPGQNVALVCTVLLVAGACLHALNHATGIPLGIRRPGDFAETHLLWVIPMTWFCGLLTARGVASILLGPIRNNASYGYWLLGVAIALATAFELTLEPYATGSKRFWSWEPASIPVDWYGTPLTTFLGWAVSALLILGFTTPAFINKSPIQPPLDYYPLRVWLLLKILFATAAITNRLWGVAALSACEIAVVAALAVYSRRKQNAGPNRAA